jgi:hypothetical protein
MAKTKLIVLEVQDKPGMVAAATAALAEAGISILSIFGWGPQGVVQLVVDNPRKAIKALKAAGTPYSEAKAEVVEISNKPGSLNAYLTKLAKKGVNLRSLCGTSPKSGRTSVLVWTAEA